MIHRFGFNARYWLHCHSSLRVSRTKIGNLKWQNGGNIILLTVGNFVTPSIQKLQILSDNKNCQSRYWLQVSYFPNILTFWRPNMKTKKDLKYFNWHLWPAYMKYGILWMTWGMSVTNFSWNIVNDTSADTCYRPHG